MWEANRNREGSPPDSAKERFLLKKDFCMSREQRCANYMGGKEMKAMFESIIKKAVFTIYLFTVIAPGGVYGQGRKMKAEPTE